MASLRSRSRPAHALVAALATIVLVGPACASDEPDPRIAELESELASRDLAQRDLASRVDDLEALLTGDETSEEDPLAEINTRVTRLQEGVDEVAAGLAAQSRDQGAAVDSLSGDIVRVDDRLAQLQAALTSLTERVDDLRGDLNSLEAQFKAHRDAEAG